MCVKSDADGGQRSSIRCVCVCVSVCVMGAVASDCVANGAN